MKAEAKAIRAAVRSLRRAGAVVVYPSTLIDLVTAYVRNEVALGATLSGLAWELGIKASTLAEWLDASLRSATATPAVERPASPVDLPRAAESSAPIEAPTTRVAGASKPVPPRSRARRGSRRGGPVRWLRLRCDTRSQLARAREDRRAHAAAKRSKPGWALQPAWTQSRAPPSLTGIGESRNLETRRNPKEVVARQH